MMPLDPFSGLGLFVCPRFRATADRQSHAGGARAQVGGRHGGMNDAPLNTKVRVASYLTVTVTVTEINTKFARPHHSNDIFKDEDGGNATLVFWLCR